MIATVKIKFLQNPIDEHNFKFKLLKNDIPITFNSGGDVVDKTYKFSTLAVVNRIAKLNPNLGLDNSFFSSFNGTVFDTAVQDDGNIIVVGNFTTYGVFGVNRAVRLQSNGTINTVFGGGANLAVLCVAVQSDGKILLGGSFTNFNGANVNRLVRLNADGTNDTTFNNNIMSAASNKGFNNSVFSVAVDGNGKILVGGGFTNFNNNSRNRIVRLNSNGTIDNTFNVGTGFGNIVNSICVNPDNSYLIGGEFTVYNGNFTNIRRVVKLNSTGGIDNTFLTNLGTGFNGTVTRVKINPNDDKIYVTGNYTSFNGNNTNRIISLNTNGTVNTDVFFGSGFDDETNSIAFGDTGDIFIGGRFLNYNLIESNRLIVLDSDGVVKNTTIINNTVNTISVTSSDDIIIGGSFTSIFGGGDLDDDEILIGATSANTISNTYSNLNSFNINSDIEYVIEDDSVVLKYNYNSTIETITIDEVEDEPDYILIEFSNGFENGIIFLEDLNSISNPAYNNSIIKYQSVLTGTTKSDVIVGGHTFSVYPFDNTFKFNFKDIVTTLINPNGFKDSILPDLSGGNFIYDDNLELIIEPQILTYNDEIGSATIAKYKFLKSVEQLPFYNQKYYSNTNNVRVLLPTKNNIDFDVTYFEGYPFDFSVQGIMSGDTFQFRNSNTLMFSNAFTASTSEVKRIFLSDGANNVTFDDVMILSSNLNKLELWVNDSFIANINIKKVESKCGVYIKWYSQSGGYSYWLFDKNNKNSIKTKEIGVINGKWDNLQNITSTSESLGKTASETIQLTTRYETKEKEYLLDLVKSPHVEMYINEVPFIQQNEFNFIGVGLADGTYNYENRDSQNKLSIVIEKPAINTITY
ncbi:MAG TPA: hypothetical protein PLL09_04660 [Flavobacterium sp.]|uniref:hypothetical protein n=1 Tax=unclassified Flavobacterium TaxID=196869 RepID=UPI0025C053DA|nr:MULTISPECIES: hypothetical protein [unclassified Flavobacterium]HRE77100.1 hypothetical protein [Flavobacterium sp.]